MPTICTLRRQFPALKKGCVFPGQPKRKVKIVKRKVNTNVYIDLTRQSPRAFAKDHKGATKKGVDGTMWKSKRNVNGNYFWARASRAKKAGRKAPVGHAKDHKGEKKKGLDGTMWVSKRNINHVYAWRRVTKK